MSLLARFIYFTLIPCWIKLFISLKKILTLNFYKISLVTWGLPAWNSGWFLKKSVISKSPPRDRLSFTDVDGCSFFLPKTIIMLQLKLNRDCAELDHSSSRQKVKGLSQHLEERWFLCLLFCGKNPQKWTNWFLGYVYGLGLYHPEVCHLLKQEGYQLNYTFNLTLKC